MAVPMVSSAEGVIFGRFTCGIASFRVESRFLWQAQYSCDIFRRCVAVFVAGAALWTCPSSFCVAGQAQHFRRVVLRVFANRIVRAASSGDKVQIPWQAWHFVRCDEN